MPYTMEDYQRDVARRYLEQLPLEERLKGLSIDEILRRFPADEILHWLPLEDIRAYIEKQEKQQKQ